MKYIQGEDSRKWWIHYDKHQQRWHAHAPVVFDGLSNTVAPGTVDARDFGEAVCHMLLNDPRVPQSPITRQWQGIRAEMLRPYAVPPF